MRAGRRRRAPEPGRAPKARQQEFRRVLRRLAEPQTKLAALGEPGGELGLFTPKNAHMKPVLRIAAALGRALESDGLIARETSGSLVITEEGHAFLRRAAAPDAPFEAQHRLQGTRYIAEADGRGAHHAVNLAESPLIWLASRKGAGGATFLNASHVEAGERLREDYTRAQLMARVTVDWRRPMSSGGAGSGQGLCLADAVIAARQRVGAALGAVGPELEDVLVTVCCNLQGLEEVERQMGWPARSGKVVLRLALDRLARHYGLIRERTKSPLRGWTA